MVARKIIHIDMDAFYASVEQRDEPAYRGRPVIVGGSPQQRGVVAACSYEARRYGIRSAMPAVRAHRLCPDAVFLSPRFDVYRQVSAELRRIFRRFTAHVEPLSLDEAYLDVSACPLGNGSATRVASAIKRAVTEETGLRASAGVSYNKFLAKLASDMDKPDGLIVITPAQGPDLVVTLPIRKFFGIGPATEAKMRRLNIATGSDLKRCSLEFLCRHFGKVGEYYFNIARAIDHRPVVSERIRKSLSTETTYTPDLSDHQAMLLELKRLAGEVWNGLSRHRILAKTLTIKVRYADFTLVTRSHTAVLGYQDLAEIYSVLPELLLRTDAGKHRVRLLGVVASNLTATSTVEPVRQLSWV